MAISKDGITPPTTKCSAADAEQTNHVLGAAPADRGTSDDADDVSGLGQPSPNRRVSHDISSKISAGRVPGAVVYWLGLLVRSSFTVKKVPFI